MSASIPEQSPNERVSSFQHMRNKSIFAAAVLGALATVAAVVALTILCPPLAIPVITAGIIAGGVVIGLPAIATGIITAVIGVGCLFGLTYFARIANYYQGSINRSKNLDGYTP